MLQDDAMKGIVRKNPNAGVSWYLLAAYAYYIEDNPVISDEAFDWLAKRMVFIWKDIHHEHKHLITLGDLRAGSLLLDENKYPSRVKGALKILRETA